MPATIRDVARAAGVSVATVSRALNGATNVLPETRQRIEDAARALRFTPSGAARSLITRRTDTIGALLPDLHGEYFSELIRGIDQAARARGLHLLVSSSHGNADEAAAALRAMNGRVDGLLVMSPHADADFLRHNLPGSLPAVLLNSGIDLEDHASFVIDNLGGATTMTRHLVASGRQRVAFITGAQGNDEAAQRLAGYRAGLKPGMREMVFDGDFSEEAGWAAGRRIANHKPRPDAVFAANDMMAVGCMAALHEAGLRVPDDIAVVGFDDIPIARYVTPALTTIRVPIAALGAAALDALVKAVEAPATQATHTVVTPVELVVRRSCGAGPPPQPRSPRAAPPH
ncbi:MAG: LacI family DNA-binding transcriptional regulator [Betaproteobacteria bacterium]|nr:LacI family DNA-binding transcriptional regulator [Betaproteobacteria bacterium]